MNQSKVLVAGTGISGIAAAKLVLERGGEVVLYDGNTALNTDEIRAKFGKDAKVGIVLGEIKRSDLLGVELCIISPGIPLNSGFVAVVDEAGIPVLREIELFWTRPGFPSGARSSWPITAPRENSSPLQEPMERPLQQLLQARS